MKHKKITSLKKFYIILSLILVVFVGYQVFRAMFVPLETQTAVMDTAYDTIDTNAFIVRNEVLMENSAKSGVLLANVQEAGRVNKGGNVMLVFQNDTQARNYTKKLELQTELEYYESLSMQSVGEAGGIDALDRLIFEKLNDTVRGINSVNLLELSGLGNAVQDAITRRQLVTGTKIDFSSKMKEIQAEIAALDKAGTKPMSTIPSTEAGYYSAKVDGYESVIDYRKVQELTTKDVENALKAKPQQSTNAIGKMIYDFDWYFVCEVDAARARELKDGQSVSVAVESSAMDAIPAVIMSRNNVSIGAEKSVLVLKSSLMNSELNNLRKEKVQIRLKSYSGLRVNKKAIRVVDGKKGVYVLIGNTVRFRKVEELYSAESYVIAKLDNMDRSSVQLYDQVIVEGKDLHDGKTVQ